MKQFLLKLTAILSFLVIPAFSSMADSPDAPPPNPGGNPGPGGTPVGAPIDGGLSILLILGAGYGSWKVYKAKNQCLPENQF